jgi:hypothetical protein
MAVSKHRDENYGMRKHLEDGIAESTITIYIVPLIALSVEGDIANIKNFPDAIRDFFVDNCEFSSV